MLVKTSVLVFWAVMLCGRRLFNEETQVRAQGSPFRTCGSRSRNGTDFSPSPSVSPVIITPPLFHIHSRTIRMMDTGPVSGPFLQRQFHTIAPIKKNTWTCKQITKFR